MQLLPFTVKPIRSIVKHPERLGSAFESHPFLPYRFLTVCRDLLRPVSSLSQKGAGKSQGKMEFHHYVLFAKPKGHPKIHHRILPVKPVVHLKHRIPAF